MSSPKIVVLDGYAANPGDLSWDSLGRLGTLEVFDRSEPSVVAERSRGATVIVTNKVPIRADLLRQLEGLRSVAVMATGYDIVDVDVAQECGVVVQNVPAYSTESVAQLVFSHLLNLANRASDHAAAVRTGKWAAGPDWCFWDHPQVELAGQTLGIVGLGRIGRAVARIALAFGMQVLATKRTPLDVTAHPELAAVELVDLARLLREADVVSLHCPLTEATRHLINAESLATMKRTAYLINTGRGPLIDSAALAATLANGGIAGAGLDVLESEPPPLDHPLTNLDKCFVTPHVAWATRAARERLMQVLVTNVQSLLAGKPDNVVNS